MRGDAVRRAHRWPGRPGGYPRRQPNGGGGVGRVVRPREDLLEPRERRAFIPGKYVPTGKWMDGWESRRKRGPAATTGAS